MTKAALESDSELQRAVLHELEWDTRVKATEVGVAVDNGVVTLTGTVNSYGKKVASAEAAHRVRGVLDVANRIEIRLAPGAGRSDTEIAKAVRHALEWNPFIRDDRIRSTVADGVVRLEGDVDTLFERREAEGLVQNLAGVRGVHNWIEVKRSNVDPDDVRLAIEDALERRADREAARIGVAVVDGLVMLSGPVPSWREKRAILGAVGHASGVHSIEDHLRIDPYL